MPACRDISYLTSCSFGFSSCGKRKSRMINCEASLDHVSSVWQDDGLEKPDSTDAGTNTNAFSGHPAAHSASPIRLQSKEDSHIPGTAGVVMTAAFHIKAALPINCATGITFHRNSIGPTKFYPCNSIQFTESG